MEQQQTKFEQWCIVGLFGHTRIAGLVSEQAIGGQTFVRVDVPAVEQPAQRLNPETHQIENYTETVPAFTKFYGTGAIYDITPVEEGIARALAQRLVTRPVNPFELPQLRQLQEPIQPDGEREQMRPMGIDGLADPDDPDDDDDEAEIHRETV